jgi:hypothetical protein
VNESQPSPAPGRTRALSRRTRLWVAIVSVVAALASIVVVAGPAQAHIPGPCQTRTWTSDLEPSTSMTYYSGGWWKWGHFFVSECRATVNYVPYGYRYNQQGRVDVRIRVYKSNGNTAYTTNWIVTYGGDPVVKVAGFRMTPGTEFSLEAKVYSAPAAMKDYWPHGKIQF